MEIVDIVSMSAVACIFMVVMVILVCLFLDWFSAKQKEEQIAESAKFRKEMETAIRNQLPEAIKQAIHQSVEIIKEEQNKKE